MKTLYLHIGIHKTGSTSIQAYLYAARDLIERKGYFYPARTRYNGQVSHSPIAWELQKGVTDLWEQSIVDLKDGHKAIVLSSEEFSLFTESQVTVLKEALSGFDVRPVMYVRNQLDLIPSEYAEWVKNGVYSGEPFIFVRNLGVVERLDFSRLYERWASAFGSDRVLLSTFESAVASDGGLVRHFLESIGLRGFDNSPSTAIHANPSPSKQYLLASRLLSVLIDYYAGRVSGEDPQNSYNAGKAAIMHMLIARYGLGREKGCGHLFGEAECRRILYEFRGKNERLFAMLGEAIPTSYQLLSGGVCQEGKGGTTGREECRVDPFPFDQVSQDIITELANSDMSGSQKDVLAVGDENNG